MKSRLVPAIALFLLAVGPLAAPALAGGMISSGGEYLTAEENPWFVGDAPVTWCVDQGADFSASPATSRETIAAVLDDWSVALGDLDPAVTARPLPDGQTKSLTLRFTEVEPCQSDTALLFRLGQRDAEITDALRYHARYTLALALSPGVDPRTGRVPQGRVWLAPDQGADAYGGPHPAGPLWQSRAVLYDVLLHEVGHVFGMPHTQTGFMRMTYPADVARTPPAVHDSAQLLVRESWWPLHRMVCGHLVLGTTFDLGAVLGVAPIDDGRPLCLVPSTQGPDRVAVTMIVEHPPLPNPNAPIPGSAQAAPVGAPPIAWPDGEGMTNEPDRIAGMYDGPDSGDGADYWEHVFVSVPAHLRLRGMLTADGRAQPMLLEQQGDDVDLIFGQGQSFRIFRLQLDSLP